MTPQEIQDFKDKIEKETLEKVIRKVTVTDSYFYAEMIITKHADPMDPFSGDKVNVSIKFNLFNSKDFINPNMVNDRPRHIKAKEIRTDFILESDDLIKSKEDAMMLVYEEIAKEIAKDLFQQNAKNIQMNITERKKKYING
jgi:hypothetical protein